MLIFATEPLRFDDTIIQAIEEIEEGRIRLKVKLFILTGMQDPSRLMQASSER